MKKSYLISIIISFIIFIGITIMVKTNSLSFEENIFNFLQNHSNSFIKIIMFIITTFGEWFMFVFFLILCLLSMNKKHNIMIIINFILAIILNNILKIVFARERPIWNIINSNGFSYPSGHTMTSFCFYGLLIYLLYKYYQGKYKKLIITLLSCLISLIGLSRIYFGVHYLTDVIGAYSFAFGYLLIYIYIMKRKNYV